MIRYEGICDHPGCSDQHSYRVTIVPFFREKVQGVVIANSVHTVDIIREDGAKVWMREVSTLTPVLVTCMKL